MRYISRALLPGALGFAVAVLVAACGGGSGLFSGEEANNLNNQLNTIAAAIDGGRCNAADRAARHFDDSVSNLSGINNRLQQNLKQASSALAAQAQNDCLSRQTATAPPKPPKTKTKTKTSTTTTNTTPTHSTPTTPTATSPPTSTAPTTPTTPATTSTGTGTTSTSGGAGLTSTGTSTGTAGSGGASAGNGNGNAQ